jgi:hypothetical protein
VTNDLGVQVGWRVKCEQECESERKDSDLRGEWKKGRGSGERSEEEE